MDAAEVAAIARAIARAPLAAFDLEWLSADRLVPKLALVQVGWVAEQHQLSDAPEREIVAAILADTEVRLVDPLAVDAAPIARALAAHPCVIAHAPRQDLALLAQRFGVELPGLVDTQLMAAFAGLGDQIGYAALANELCGTELAKDQQWTAWDRRPLTAAQLAYAAADVKYLPALYARLARRLGEARVAWVRAETAEIGAAALAAVRVTPETAWRELSGTRGLDAASLGVVIALAAWRQRLAIEIDRPLGQVLNDKVLLDLARHRPASAAGVRDAKGISPIAKTRADDVTAVIAAAPLAPDGAVRAAGRPPSARAQRWAELLVAIAHAAADAAGLAPRLLATKADAEDFARTVDERGLAAASELPALATWRRELLGEVWRGWLAGETAIVGDPASPHGVRIVPR